MTIKKFNVDSLDQTANVRLILNSDLGNITLGNVYVANLFDLSGNTFSPGGGGGGGTVSVAAIPPGTPTLGSFWLDNDTGDLSVYYDSTWVGVSSYIGSNVGVSGSSNVSTGSSSVESFTALSNSTGTLNHDFEIGSVFHHNGLAGDITVNFSNVPISNNTITNFVIIIYQGSTAYNISAVQVNGVTQIVNWFDNITPAGTANKKEVYSFNLVRLGANWHVHGSQSQYG